MICQSFVVVFASASAFCFDFGFQTYLREVWSLLEGVSAGLGPGPSSLGSQSLPALFICVVVGTSIFLLLACLWVCNVIFEYSLDWSHRPSVTCGSTLVSSSMRFLVHTLCAALGDGPTALPARYLPVFHELLLIL